MQEVQTSKIMVELCLDFEFGTIARSHEMTEK